MIISTDARTSPEHAGASDRNLLLAVSGLRKYFPIRRGLLRKVVGETRAVDGVSFEVRRGEMLGLVGESGSGKTTVGRCLMRLLQPTAGRILLYNAMAGVDLCGLSARKLRDIRPRLQMIFQDPHSSLNPRMTVGEIVGEPLIVNRVAKGTELNERVATLLELVGLNGDDLRRYPHAFSGGQRQRIGIARALALRPELVIADEPVSALDVSVQAQILNLLAELRERIGFSCIFIAHDLSVVEHICDRVAVMYLGRIVEIGDTDTLYRAPQHPYTEALLSAVPIPDPVAQRERTRVRLEGEVPDASSPPPGCPFHPRCRYAEPLCRECVPELRPIAEKSLASCHLSEKLNLKGV
ncbi:MAG: ABC transporter ATP-binding protein [Candidatus Hydrogenedentes bacterium]|nr:ABC transporter ATP-binding protein [Candidatus Hydrogenedentota bacterium]